MFVRFYLLPKIHKWVHINLGRPIISNCGYTRKTSNQLTGFYMRATLALNELI